MSDVDGVWQVDVLNFVDGIPGVLENAASKYGHTCHEIDKQFPSNAAALGYRSIPEDKQDITISKPEDIYAISDF